VCLESAAVAGGESKLPGRSPEQRLHALGVANSIRTARAELKRELKTGDAFIVDVIADPPDCARTAKIYDLLLALPKVGPSKASRILAHCRIARSKTLAGLSERQRSQLLELLKR
jgi:S13-like H2TH domain